MEQKIYNTLSDFRNLASEAFILQKKPTKRLEEWRYSDLTLLSSQKEIVSKNIDFSIPTTDSYTIVFKDGKLNKDQLYLPKNGVHLHVPEDKEFLEALTIIDFENGFDTKYQVLQNYSKMTDGVLINITQTLDKPLRIYYLHESCHNFTTFINLANDASVKLHEEFIQCGGDKSHLNQVTKIKLGEKANCTHFKQSNNVAETNFLYTSEVICEKYAKYDNYVVNHGYASYRQDIQCYLNGEGASGNFYGTTIGEKKEIYDIILKVKHNSSHTNSMQHYNQIFAEASSGSFYSKVEIPELLSKIEAHQLNKNLLLDEGAKAFSRPELDINSDDVICSHGATVGAIDDAAIEYLKSRGISDKAAKELLIQGFLRSVFEDKNLDERDHLNLISQLSNSMT